MDGSRLGVATVMLAASEVSGMVDLQAVRGVAGILGMVSGRAHFCQAPENICLAIRVAVFRHANNGQDVSADVVTIHDGVCVTLQLVLTYRNSLGLNVVMRRNSLLGGRVLETAVLAGCMMAYYGLVLGAKVWWMQDNRVAGCCRH